MGETMKTCKDCDAFLTKVNQPDGIPFKPIQGDGFCWVAGGFYEVMKNDFCAHNDKFIAWIKKHGKEAFKAFH